MHNKLEHNEYFNEIQTNQCTFIHSSCRRQALKAYADIVQIIHTYKNSSYSSCSSTKPEGYTVKQMSEWY